ncbi:hypothetical protein G6F42_015679 [Rhizopus arrhizus]|nr:hypothetical protein G6F42_015679 [Rhizopus arrhizus]
MWRSWVDRINTINKSSEEPSISKEDLLKQEQQQARIRDIWQRCNDLLSNEQERSQGFLTEFLLILIETHEQFGNALVFESIPDDRAFMSSLTKELISGIRKVPEHKTLMDNLRSKSHLYNVIRAIRVVSFGPNSILLLMLQQRIPSVIIKLFRSFIDLAPSYYDQTQQVEDMVSIEDVGNTMADILKQCVRNASVLHRLITEDTFFMMIRIMTAKPIDSVAQDSEPAYLIWKSKTVDILKSVDMNGEVCQYLHNRRCVDLVIRLWRDCISKDYLTFVDYREIHLGLDLIYFQLERSAKIQFYSLFEEMLQGYELLCKILKLGPFSDPILDLKVEIVNKLVDLSFVGKISPIPSLSDGLPYQHADFSTPQPRGLTDKIVKNTPAYQCLLASLLYPTTPTRHEIPISLQFQIFSAMKDIIEIHPWHHGIIDLYHGGSQFCSSQGTGCIITPSSK